jgi:hypothetical protein
MSRPGEAKHRSRSRRPVCYRVGLRRRLPNPNSRFDMVPPHVVDAAKRLFTRLRRNGAGVVALPDPPD